MIEVKSQKELAAARKKNPGETIVLKNADGSRTFFVAGLKPITTPKAPTPRYTNKIVKGNGG